MQVRLSLLLIPLCALGCAEPRPAAGTSDRTEAAERDEIYQLLAYAIAQKDWQSPDTTPRRGHNIAAVLVDPTGKIVGWGRNCNGLAKNTTQHAELRAMTSYLAKSSTGTLKGFSIFTTLEPCAMCAGMMMQCDVGRVVYGQTDPEFGKAAERLALDTRDRTGGYPPYPRTIRSEPSTSPIRERLDEAYRKNPFPESQGGLVGWLRTDSAKNLFLDAARGFSTYSPRFEANRALLQSARDFYHAVPERDTVLPQ